MSRLRGLSRSSQPANPHADQLVRKAGECGEALWSIIKECSLAEMSTVRPESKQALVEGNSRMKEQKARLKNLATDIKNHDQSESPNVNAVKGFESLINAIEEIKQALPWRLISRKVFHPRSSKNERRQDPDEAFEDAIKNVGSILTDVCNQCSRSWRLDVKTYEEAQALIHTYGNIEREFQGFFRMKNSCRANKIKVAEANVLWDRIQVKDTIKQHMTILHEDPGNGRMLYEETRAVTKILETFYKTYQNVNGGSFAQKNAIMGANLLPRMGAICLVLKYLDMQGFIDRFLEEGQCDLPVKDLERAIQIFGQDNITKAETFLAEQYRVYRREHWDAADFLQFDLQPGEPTPFAGYYRSNTQDHDKGGYCDVYFVQDVYTKAPYAVKIAICYRPDEYSAKHVQDDFTHLSKLPKHKHLLRVHKLYFRRGLRPGMANEYGMVMQKADISLQQLLNRYCEDRIVDGSRYSWVPRILLSSFGCLAFCLQHIHENCTRHRDIKPDNILIQCGINNHDNDTVLIADFGAAHSFSGNDSNSKTRSPKRYLHAYSAPEVALKGVTNSNLENSSVSNVVPERGRKEDVFSLGLVFLKMLGVLLGEWSYADKLPGTLRSFHPFHKNLDQLYRWIDLKEEKLKKDQPQSELLLLLRECRMMVQRKDTDRPTAKEVVADLSLRSNPGNPNESFRSNEIQNRKEYFCEECWRRLHGDQPTEEQRRPTSWLGAIRRQSTLRLFSNK